MVQLALTLGRENSETQGRAVLRVLHSAGRALTPFEVRQFLIFEGRRLPITSVRRALTDLTRLGKAEKTDETTTEQLGASNHKWRSTTGGVR